MNVPFKFPFIHGLISTLHAKSANPRGALYALINCPCFISCHRGVVQLVLLGNGLCFTFDVVVTDEFVVPRVVVGFSLVFIFPSLVKFAHAFTGGAGWI